MIVCLQIGVNGWRAIHRFLAPVEDLGALCRMAKGQQEFRDAFAEAQFRLSSNALSDSGSEISASNLAGQREQAILNGMVALSQGLKRYKQQASWEGDKSMHFRLPAISTRIKESLEFWAGYMETRLDHRFPCLTIASAGLGPVDIIAGEPEAHDFFCLKAGETSLPMTRAYAGDKHLADAQLEAKVYLRSFELGSIKCNDNRQLRWWWPFK